jgi:hypothetical protein
MLMSGVTPIPVAINTLGASVAFSVNSPNTHFIKSSSPIFTCDKRVVPLPFTNLIPKTNNVVPSSTSKSAIEYDLGKYH